MKDINRIKATIAFLPRRMESGLNDLRAARAELVAALPNKGGHRVAAIGYIDQAISEVKAGMVAGM